MSGNRAFMASLDALDEATATFGWHDGDTVDRVRVEIPRHEWEKAGRISVVTITLADLRTRAFDAVSIVRECTCPDSEIASRSGHVSSCRVNA